MTTRHNLSNTDNPLYTDWLDILLEWGQVRLLIQDNDVILRELEGRWEYLKAIQTPLDGGIEVLEGNIESALSLLNGNSTVNIDVNYAEPIISAMQSLDQAVFLSEALDSFSQARELDPLIYHKSEGLLRLVTAEKPPPALRLIPLNEWRKDITRLIPAHVRHLFPWYTAWTGLPDNFLDLLHLNREALQNGDARQLHDVEPAELKTLLNEINQDIPLRNRIWQDTGAFGQYHRKARSRPFARQLMVIRNQDILLRDMPDAVKLFGLLQTAGEVMGHCTVRDAVHGDDAEIGAQRFLAAFCTPFLSDEACIECFEEIRNFIDASDPTALDSENILRKVWLWDRHAITDEELVKSCYSSWNYYLSEATDRLNARTDVAGQFAQAFNNSCRRRRISPKKLQTLAEAARDRRISAGMSQTLWILLIVMVVAFLVMSRLGF